MKKPLRPLPFLSLFPLAAMLLSGGCRLARPPDSGGARDAWVVAAPDRKATSALFKEIGGADGFLMIVRYLYRWHLDEDDFQARDPSLRGQLWIRDLQAVTDENDNSRFVEVVIPALGVTVNLKKTDYRIPELKLDVVSNGYRITRVSRDSRNADEANDYVKLAFDPDVLSDRLFRERLISDYPDEALVARMKKTIAKQLETLTEPGEPPCPKTLFYAPIHSVANEVWAYWEEGKLLIRITSDVDLTKPAVWDHEALGVSIYNTTEQTVVSHEEKPGDGRFVTRDQVGRALYNCIVLGRKTVIPIAP